MSRVRNADEFLKRFRNIRSDYECRFAPIIAKVRAKYAEEPKRHLIDQSLEAHTREYFVNAFLAAVNWRLDQNPWDGLPNLVPEAPVRSQQSGNIRFLDYLGLERQTEKPLLIVESKRARAELPSALKPAATYSEVVHLGLSGEVLSEEWNKWLKDLTDYVRSADTRTQQVPRRVAITNGNWLILFLDPSDAFLEGGTANPNQIFVFENRTGIESRFSDLFLLLEHQQVLGEIAPLTPGELNFYLSGDEIDRLMHGLRLRYIEQKDIYEISPVIKIAPVLFVRTRNGAWLRIETPPRTYELPYEKHRLHDHIGEVDKAAKDLLAEVKCRLGIALHPFSLSGHYGDEEGFDTIRGVFESRPNEYLVVTGARTHYLLPTSSGQSCPYHDWVACKNAGISFDSGPIMARSTKPRSFFVSNELHHCAHRDVNSAKAAQITCTNRLLCGPRSGQDGQAFCEIWRFEQHLCCQACAFGEVCTKTTVFQIPCRHEHDNKKG